MGTRSTTGHVRPNVAWADLSPLELECARAVAEGLNNVQIAQRLHRTGVHVSRLIGILYTKSGAAPRAGSGARPKGDREQLRAWATELLKSEVKS